MLLTGLVELLALPQPTRSAHLVNIASVICPLVLVLLQLLLPEAVLLGALCLDTL